MPTPAPSPVPAGMHTITPHLWFNGEATAAIELYQRGFGAELVGEVAKTPDGNGVMHAMLRFGNSHVMIADAWPAPVRWQAQANGAIYASSSMHLMASSGSIRMR